MASLSRRRGYVERSAGIGFDREFIASFLTISIELLNSTLEKCKAEGRIQELDNSVLFITNFEAYQAIPEDKKKHIATLEALQKEKQVKWGGYIPNKE
jgi:hypothetical protein